METANGNIKKRVKFTSEQTKLLESFFHQFNFIDDKQTRHLAEEIEVTTRQIRNWFQNKRAAIRRRKFKESGASYNLVIKVAKNWSPYSSPDSKIGTVPSLSKPEDESTPPSTSQRFTFNRDVSKPRSLVPSPKTSPSTFLSNGTRSLCSSGFSSSSVSMGRVSPAFYRYPRHPLTSSWSSIAPGGTSSVRPQRLKPSVDSWRLPLSELPLNYLSDSSTPDVSPEDEQQPSTFRAKVTPPANDSFCPSSDLDSIDWFMAKIFTSSSDQIPMALDERISLEENPRGDRSKTAFDHPEMAAVKDQQPVAKSYVDLKSLTTDNIVNDSKITSIVSELEMDYEQKQNRVQNIVNFLKDA